MIGLELYSEYTYKTNDLYYCFLDEEARINEIYESVAELNNGAQFSFYNLKLSEQELYALSSLNINDDANIVAYTSEVGIEDYFYAVAQKNLYQNSKDIANTLAKLIARLVSNIISITKHDNAEIVLRTEKANTHNINPDFSKCTYWHIDKSHGEIIQNNDNIFNFPISNELQQKVFIISLSGERTIYTKIDSQQREEFLHLANETMFFYGHSEQINCTEQDHINQLFYQQKTFVASNGFGSVHFAGKHGSIHAAPTFFSNPRITLLITPI